MFGYSGLNPIQPGEAQLTARWTVTEINSNEQVASNGLRVVRPAKDNSIEAAVTALSETVADLSWEIARALMEQGEAGRATTPKSATEPRSKNNRDLSPEARRVMLRRMRSISFVWQSDKRDIASG
jgi:ABC-type transport auxiliary lipoprotein component